MPNCQPYASLLAQKSKGQTKKDTGRQTVVITSPKGHLITYGGAVKLDTVFPTDAASTRNKSKCLQYANKTWNRVLSALQRSNSVGSPQISLEWYIKRNLIAASGCNTREHWTRVTVPG